MTPFRALLALLLCGILLSSCSHSFRRDWKSAIRGKPATGIEGAWSGSWKSEATGHQGKLRCVIGPASGDGHDFHYHATWMGILSGSYHAKHQVRHTPSGATFKGQHQMPAWAGGLYTYEGSIRGDDFQASYRCAKDHGSFSMKRVR